ncbi:MAG: isoleucine--tRNA ligase [Candidatus Shapirobacteria bacterium]
MFKPVASQVNFARLSEEILAYWQKSKIFEKSVDRRPADKPYSFYDGPPFVTGLPHYGTLLPSMAKDVIPRYQTMKGYRVRRVWGWDCHGLPIENKVEEKLGLKNRREILAFGINNFIDECRKYVEAASSEWPWYVDHIGRWVDMKYAYRTMDLTYMESVIWVFKQLYDKGLIYQGNRVSLFCPRCSTPISNFEIAMDNSYRLMEDPAVTIKFQIHPATAGSKFKNVGILAWTTTPWTLPANRALVVDKNEEYVLLETKGEKLILAHKRVKKVLSEKYQILAKFKGEKLLGLSYWPLYNFFPADEKDFKVYDFAGMVNMEEGTGVVHSAPGFGEIDTQMSKHHGLTMVSAVDDEGRLTKEVKPWAGIYVKKADPLIISELQQRGLLFRREKITHRHPFCYRCQTPLIYKAQESWFVDIQKLKPQLLKTNKKINWVPEHFKFGRFQKSVENAPDWCISRNRYWATVMPVWRCKKCRDLSVFGSIKEIEVVTGEKVTDLHRNGVDHLTFKCDKCKGTKKRIPEVLDCWMESGSMPYAQWHYPFENKEDFKRSYPADYIIEYVGQVRAWFYVMHVVANALTQSESFKNVVVTGVMAGVDGRKMSKSYRNYPDPRAMLEKYGGDALRLYFMGSSVMLGKDINITEGGEFEEQVKKILLPLWNSYRYLVTFAKIYKFKKSQISTNALDRWIITRINQFNQEVSKSLDQYRLPDAVKELRFLTEDLSNWYIRRSRERFNRGDKDALATLHWVLVQFCLIAAPIIPFVTEEIYRNLTGKESVHLADWPKQEKVDQKLLTDMVWVRKVCELGNAARKEAGIRTRQPLKKLTVNSKQLTVELTGLIQDELNVKKVVFIKDKGELKVELDTKITPELLEEGKTRDLIREIQALRKKACLSLKQKIEVAGSWFPANPKLIEDLKQKVLAKKLVKANKLHVRI